MRRPRTVAAIAVVVLVAAGLVIARGRAKTCPPASLGRGKKVYGISSQDIGRRISCATAHAVAREAARRHSARHVRGWTIVYREDCQCRTATRVLAGRRVTFTFDAT